MNAIVRTGPYRTTEGYFPIPPELVDWSTHVFELPGPQPLRFTIHRNGQVDLGGLVDRARVAIRRGLRRMVFTRDEALELACGPAFLLGFVFEDETSRAYQSKLFFNVGATVFAASVHTVEGDMGRADEVMRHFMTTIAPHPKEDE